MSCAQKEDSLCPPAQHCVGEGLNLQSLKLPLHSLCPSIEWFNLIKMGTVSLFSGHVRIDSLLDGVCYRVC